MIDGRQEVLAHGSREMPVWGDWFNRELLREELFGEELRNLSIKTRIDGLMTYIEALQAK